MNACRHPPANARQRTGIVAQPRPRPTVSSPRAPRTKCRAGWYLAFLPWNGCDAGGFYSTGVNGTPGRSCQEVYQPAAHAEERFRLKQACAQVDCSSSSKAEVESSPSPVASFTPAAESSEQASSEAPAASQLSSEARRFLRDELVQEQRQRTQEIIDAAWQSLE